MCGGLAVLSDVPKNLEILRSGPTNTYWLCIAVLGKMFTPNCLKERWTWLTFIAKLNSNDA